MWHGIYTPLLRSSLHCLQEHSMAEDEDSELDIQALLCIHSSLVNWKSSMEVDKNIHVYPSKMIINRGFFFYQT